MDLVVGIPFLHSFLIFLLNSCYQKYFCSLYKILPAVLTDGTNSTIRFNVLIYVDLPQPEGPIIAVTLFSKISKLMFCKA